MKLLIKTSILIVVFFTLSSCSTGPQTIDYGNDGCHFCKMTIVDKIHASELITDKGKVYKFDATECMLNYMHENQDLPIASLYTNYYEAPTELIISEEATYLISKKLPSPMGGNLTAFKTTEKAEEILEEKQGKLYTWDELRTHLKR